MTQIKPSNLDSTVVDFISNSVVTAISPAVSTAVTASLANITVGTIEPRISTIINTNSVYNTIEETALGPNGGYIRIIGTGFFSNSVVLFNNVNAPSYSYISSTEMRAQIPAVSPGGYSLNVVNYDGATAARIISISGIPLWVTGSQLPSTPKGGSLFIPLTATGDSPITYSLQPGSSLPPGLGLSESGILSGSVFPSGAVGSTVTYSFTVLAKDADLQTSPRTFSLPIAITNIVITANSFNINEGGNAVISVLAEPLGNTTLFYTLAGTINSQDLVSGSLSGNVNIVNNVGNVTIGISTDATIEPTETMIFQLRIGSTSGTIVGTAEFAVNDTSAGIALTYLLVAGGGGSPRNGQSGGSGAGGAVTGSISTNPADYPITITVGAGGVQSNGSNSTITGSTIASVVAIGGGRGGNVQEIGIAGGSGGGGASQVYNPNASYAGGAALQPTSASGGFGGAGSTGFSFNWGYPGHGGGAGGNAAEPGSIDNPATASATAGPGRSFAGFTGIGIGDSDVLASGGGGAPVGGYVWAPRGRVQGGGGSYADPAGLPNTGGGCAGYGSGAPDAQYVGGSGIGVIRYPGTNARLNGGNVVVSGGFVYHIFRTTGQLTL